LRMTENCSQGGTIFDPRWSRPNAPNGEGNMTLPVRKQMEPSSNKTSSVGSERRPNVKKKNGKKKKRRKRNITKSLWFRSESRSEKSILTSGEENKDLGSFLLAKDEKRTRKRNEAHHRKQRGTASQHRKKARGAKNPEFKGSAKEALRRGRTDAQTAADKEKRGECRCQSWGKKCKGGSPHRL